MRSLLAGLVVASAIAASCARSPSADLTPDIMEFDAGAPDASCQGLACKRVMCSGRTTTLRGRVFDPAGKRPVYGAAVYVPIAELHPIQTGARCRLCEELTVSAVVSTLSDGTGTFVLEDVPVDSAIPVVVELGSFRRTIMWSIAPCADNVIPDGMVRLPKNTDEGDLPRMAVTTGGADSLECLLRGMGIDDVEFVPGGPSTRHVHIFRGTGGGGITNATVPDASSFWNDLDQLRGYDLVALSCEGDEANDTKGGTAPGARGPMHEYARAGGHVFATHFHRTWLEHSPYTDFQAIAEWGGAAVVGTSYEIDTSFPKGAAFSAWLGVTGATKTPGSIDLQGVTYSVGAVRKPAQAWIERGNDAVRYFSFNTPVDAEPTQQCGRVVFGDLHVSGKGGGDFPGSCGSRETPLTPEQLALEFLLFDALACVRDDRQAPVPPR
jgi:hypothetical protein